tara:strand:- start:59 stop:541 length:483 start_codon:yes stop_codon:yes gene_type:complete
MKTNTNNNTPTKTKISAKKFDELVLDNCKLINDTKKECGISLTLQERKVSQEKALQNISRKFYFGKVGNYNHFEKSDQKRIDDIVKFIKAQKKASKTGLKAIDKTTGIEYSIGHYLNKTGKVLKPKTKAKTNTKTKAKTSKNPKTNKTLKTSKKSNTNKK